ncbi:MAG: phosphatidylserine decarboxylase [Sphingomonadaceae bacterium]|nr:phosphatidylserine decarboxylase [Sphingomonadaceae bacterium]
MTELEKPPGADRAVRWQWPSIHPEGYRYIAIAAALALIFLLLDWEIVAWPLVGLTVWVVMFFRDPVRVTPEEGKYIVAPADGLVTLIREVMPPPELAGAEGLGEAPLVRISIFMSVFDAHVNRTPIGGTIRRVVYISGKFVNADLDKASEDNERQHILVEDAHGVRVGFTQIAGLVARRIVTFVKPGDMVARGQRIGLIRFGSRLDVFLPPGVAPRVILGQRAIAGETILGELGNGERSFGIAQ